MFTVYALYAPQYNKIYIGYTSDLEQRMLSHNKLGKKEWTIKFRPWDLVFTEEFDSKDQAMRREKQLKSAKGRAFVRMKVKEKYG